MARGMTAHERGEYTTVEWLTPPYIIKALGEFDLDPCFSGPRPWDTAKEHYEELGLMRPWFGRVWLNPPYGQGMERWLNRLAEHGTGTALVFGRTDTATFQQDVFPKASAIMFLAGRLGFHKLDGSQPKEKAGAPSVLIAYGQPDSEILRDCGIEGYYIKLR